MTQTPEYFPYDDLVDEVAMDFLPDEHHDNETYLGIMKAVFLKITASYLDVDDEPFVQHPGDEYIIGNLISEIENPTGLHGWVGEHTQYPPMEELEFQKHGANLIGILEAEYGQAVEPGGMFRITPKLMGRPAGHLSKDDFVDYYPGDGIYRDRDPSSW